MTKERMLVATDRMLEERLVWLIQGRAAYANRIDKINKKDRLLGREIRDINAVRARRLLEKRKEVGRNDKN